MKRCSVLLAIISHQTYSEQLKQTGNDRNVHQQVKVEGNYGASIQRNVTHQEWT